MKGNIIRGHGGKYGTYPQHSLFSSDISSFNDPSHIKSSVLSSRGMINSTENLDLNGYYYKNDSYFTIRY
jgi:hypothetical protein